MRPPPSTLPPWRLFFPAAALGGSVAIGLLWAGVVGSWSPPGDWTLGRWHAHEMIFGHVFAAFAGVLLTALPRWTGCAPIPPATTLTLATAWLVGRAAMVVDPSGLFALASPVFVAGLGIVAGRRILTARDRRDLPILAILAVAAVADVACLLDPGGADGGVAPRLGLAATIAVATVMGGRVTPALTRHLGLSAGRDLDVTSPPVLEGAVAVATLAGLAVWVAAVPAAIAVPVSAAAALVHALRLARWHGATTMRRPSILALHVGYGFLPLGFALSALGTGLDDAALLDAGRHAWGVGVLGVLCFAVQASVTRRHGGRALDRDRIADLACLALIVAAAARLAWPLLGWTSGGLAVAVGAWLAAQGPAFGLPLRPARRDGAPRPTASTPGLIAGPWIGRSRP